MRAAVCQPLATKPWKIVSCAASSLRWKGCGSNSAAKALICSLLIRSRPDPRSAPRQSLRGIARSSELAPVLLHRVAMLHRICIVDWKGELRGTHASKATSRMANRNLFAFYACAEMATRMPIAIMEIACTK